MIYLEDLKESLDIFDRDDLCLLFFELECLKERVEKRIDEIDKENERQKELQRPHTFADIKEEAKNILKNAKSPSWINEAEKLINIVDKATDPYILCEVCRKSSVIYLASKHPLTSEDYDITNNVWDGMANYIGQFQSFINWEKFDFDFRSNVWKERKEAG